MTEVYRKRGAYLRYENGTLIAAQEGGEAVEEGSLFSCAPFPGEALPTIADSEVVRAVSAIESAAGALRRERLIVTDGHAEHAMGERSWSERHQRVHLSLVNGGSRLLIDEATFEVPDLPSVAARFARIGDERSAPVRLKLAARVVAAVTRPLMATLPPNVEAGQVAGGVDGKGQVIEPSAGPAWPNWYRPSYRVRPVRTPLNVVLRCNVTTIEEGLPEAVALLAPPDGPMVRALVVDGDAAYPATIRIVRLDAITAPVRWFPYGAGVWAGEAEVVT